MRTIGWYPGVLIDRLGRRKLLLAGLIGMAARLIAVGVAFHFIEAKSSGSSTSSSLGLVTLVALVGYIVCFACSMGSVTWTVINEVFPGRIRGRAVAMATAVIWGSAFVVSQGFLSLVGSIGEAFTFWLFAVFCALAWAWIYVAVPETKGQSLEQIGLLWQARQP